ncbi:MAG: hypothetical protein AB7T63_08075 [Planctomycetota bacterium]
MATYNLKRFTRPGALRAIHPDHLRALLAEHEAYFSARGHELPPAGSANGFDYEGLARVFMTPDTDTPPALSNALYLIHEMSTPGRMDELMCVCEREGIRLNAGPEPTPADVAVQVWLHAPDLLDRLHAEHYLTRPRSFEYYQTDRVDPPEIETPSHAVLAALAKDLDQWFLKNRRGRGAQVEAFPKDDSIWFLVRHAEPLERKGIVVGEGESDSLLFRAQAHDVVVYYRALGELQIHANTKREKDLYRKMFGRHLFGHDEFFPGTGKYTLDPLRTHGSKSLACDDIDGIESVKLKQVEVFWGGPEKEITTHKANDLFRAMEAGGRALPEKARMTRASFAVKFSDSKTPRTVTIRPSNVAQFLRDGDSAVTERWLQKRGFILAGR